MGGEKVILEEIIDSVQRIIIRTGVGWFTNSGPRGNIITVESQVAFSTTVNELYREGYEMVSPEEYAERYGLGVEAVQRKIREEGEEGSLFLLLYPEREPPSEAVPLDEIMESEEFVPHLL